MGVWSKAQHQIRIHQSPIEALASPSHSSCGVNALPYDSNAHMCTVLCTELQLAAHCWHALTAKTSCHPCNFSKGIGFMAQDFRPECSDHPNKACLSNAC